MIPAIKTIKILRISKRSVQMEKISSMIVAGGRVSFADALEAVNQTQSSSEWQDLVCETAEEVKGS